MFRPIENPSVGTHLSGRQPDGSLHISSTRSGLRSLALIIAVGLTATACASGGKQIDTDGENGAAIGTPIAVSTEIADPIEGFNRAMFTFNDKVDAAVFKPAAKVYRFVVPEAFRDAIRNFLRNLEAPVVLANDLLQGEFKRGGETTTRFLLNSTLGLGGLFDVADRLGIEYHDEDFGQTLAVWGVGNGFYLVLPFFGPSSLRDGIGSGVDSAMSPLGYLIGSGPTQTAFSVGKSGLKGIDEREQNLETLDQIKADSIDFYARIKSMYAQHRKYLIENGDDPDALEAPNLIIIDTGDGLGSEFEDAFGSDFEDITLIEDEPFEIETPGPKLSDKKKKEGIDVEVITD